MSKVTVDIPISAAKLIADKYGYDQVVIVARKVGGREHVTTYGVDKTNCGVAARIGDFFKHKLMGWPEPTPEIHCPEKLKPGGCTLHNLHCGWPACNQPNKS